MLGPPSVRQRRQLREVPVVHHKGIRIEGDGAGRLHCVRQLELQARVEPRSAVCDVRREVNDLPRLEHRADSASRAPRRRRLAVRQDLRDGHELGPRALMRSPALISPIGTPQRVYEAWKAGRFDLLTSAEQLDEFARVTRYPTIRRIITRSEAGHMLNQIRALAITVTPRRRPAISTDSADDDFLFAIAEAGDADYIA